MQLRKSSIIITLVAIMLVTILAAFFLRPQGKVEFALAPEEATLTIKNNVQTIRNKQVISVSPGTYTFSIKRDQFSTESVAVTVKKNETLRVVVALNPKTDEARKLIENNPESVKITEEYEGIKQARLYASLPLSGVNYSIDSCRSIKYPQSDKKALCITHQTEAGEMSARLAILQLGYDVEEYEVLSGPTTLKTLIKTDTYKIEAYANDPDEHPHLYITPLNVAYVPPTAPRNEPLEAIRTASLAHLKEEGYELDEYVIIYSNMYLSRYSADVHNHGEQNANSSVDG